jgi:N-acetylgalactosamine kinase
VLRVKKSLATIILAGGKGTRMGSNERHKVCFEVLGVPVIVRALETYNLCGSSLNVIVVGVMAASVKGMVSPRFPGTSYAYQETPRGTGDAARKGAEILERMGFEGDVLVVAGDKVIDPKVIRQLLATHEEAGAEVTLATAKRPPDSSAGILLKSADGNIIGILEEAERRRVVAIAALNEAIRERDELSREAVDAMVERVSGEKTARALAGEIWRTKSESACPRPEDGSASDTAKHPAADALTRGNFEARFTVEERLGCVQVGGERVPAARMLERFDQMNMSTYLFRAPVLYDALCRLKPDRANQEEYLTDVFEILARGEQPAKIVGCEISNANDLMAFNNLEELLAIQEVYQQRTG